MAGPGDYQAMLQSMSAMSQQFSWSGYRNRQTPQRLLSQRSRIQKPSSRNTSPQNLQRRRTAPTGKRPSGVSYSTGPYQLQPTDPAQHSQYVPGQINVPPSADWRSLPMNITHRFPNSAEPCMYQRPQGMPSDMRWSYSDGWASTLPRTTAESYQTVYSPMTTFDLNAAGVQQMPDLSLSTTGAFLPPHNFDRSIYTSPCGQRCQSINVPPPTSPRYDAQPAEQGGKVLVGISLYDNGSPASSSSYPNNGSLSRSRLAGHGLKLEETWSPAAEEVPDVVADDGIATPATMDIATFPTDSNATHQENLLSGAQSVYTGTIPQLQLPYEISGEPFVFDEEMGLLASQWDMDGTKSLPMYPYDIDHIRQQQQSGPYL